MIDIKEFNEFTWDMVRALPKINYHIEQGNEVKVICKKNLKKLYEQFTPHVEVSDKFNPVNDDSTYNHQRPGFTKSEWSPPNLRKKWKDYITFDKPTIVVQNKYTIEWSRKPFNYFDINFLDIFFETFKYDYQIIYIRPNKGLKDYYTDDNDILEFKDYELINEKHPEIYTIEDMLKENPDLDYNSCQFALHSTSTKHISPSGGNACLSAYFGGDLLIFDTYCITGPLRGIWKTDSWLKDLGGSKIYGFSEYNNLINKAKELWK